MNVSVVVRHMEVTDAMRSYAQEKASRLPRLFNGLQSAVITLDLDAGDHLVEIVASASHKAVFIARQRGSDMYACVDQCIHKLKQQLRRHKDRVRDRQAPGHDQTMVPERPPEQ